MANPTLSASLDKSSYAPGETMTLTVTYTDADNWSRVDTITVTGTDQAGNPATVTLNTLVTSQDPVSVDVADSSGRSWTKQSDSNGVAVFTASA